MATPANTKIRVQVLKRGDWGGTVIAPNADYASGGPIHPDDHKAARDAAAAAKAVAEAIESRYEAIKAEEIAKCGA